MKMPSNRSFQPAGADARRRGRRGAVLIMSLGVLVVLAMLGTVFATISSIERDISRNYVDQIQARMLAESGVQYALAELANPLRLDIWGAPRTPPWVYFGNAPVPAGADPGAYNAVPLSQARTPSFFLDANNDGVPDPLTPSGAPARVMVNGVPAGISGYTSLSSYTRDGNVYSLRVIDLGSKINVNNVHPRLVQILTNLFTEIPGFPGAPATAAGLIDSRRPPVRGYASMGELRRMLTDRLGAASGDAVFTAIRPYVAVNGWVDGAVTRPFGLNERRRSLGVGDDIYAQWELRPRNRFDPRYDFQPRTPVNINQAPYPVLVALLRGLQGYYVREDREISAGVYDSYEMTYRYNVANGGGRRYGNHNWKARVGTIYQTPAVGRACAQNLANRIVAARRTFAAGTGYPRNYFRSVRQFDAFIDGLPAGDFAGISAADLPYVRDAIKANFNPNVHLNELNPDELVALSVDKTDLSYHTFEFTFFPMGYFEIQSAGRVLDAGRQVVAEDTVTAEVKAYDVHRDTLQDQFMKDYADGTLPLNQVFSAATGAERMTDNVSLRSYPEYQDRGFLQTGSGTYAPSFDGYLALNNVRTMNGSPNFALRFDTESNSIGNAFLPNNGPDRRYRREVDRGNTARGPYPEKLLGGGNPGSLANDGLICERQASPGYPPANFNQRRGTLSMWVKPHFEPEDAGRMHNWFSNIHYNVPGENWNQPWPSRNLGTWYTIFRINPFVVLYAPGFNSGGFGQAPYGEGAAIDYDYNDTTLPQRAIIGGYGGRANGVPSVSRDTEYIGGRNTATVNHAGHGHSRYSYNGRTWGNLCMKGRWLHVGLTWDDTLSIGYHPSTGRNPRQPDPDNVLQMWVNGQKTPGSQYDTYYVSRVPPGQAYRMTANNRWGSDWFRVGAQADSPVPPGTQAANGPSGPRLQYNYTADATIDEVLIWWTPDDPGSGSRFISPGYRQGRYYKQDNARFTSPVVQFGGSPRVCPPPVSGGASAAIGNALRRLGLFAYTACWPVGDPNDPEVQNMSGTTVSLSVLNPARTTYWMPLQAATRGGTAVSTSAAGPWAAGAAAVDVPGGQFRYRIQLAPNYAIGNKANTPFKSTPVLDDVTITYYDGPATILSWIVGAD